MITLSQVSKRYGEVTAVQEVSLEIATGETVALVGTSGSGKTTLLRMMNRMVEPSEGTILIDGSDISSKPAYELRRSMGYVIQNHGLFPHRTVAENIATVPSLLGWEKNKIQTRAEKLLSMLGLDPELFVDRFPSELSGGQKQRVSVARALAADPPVILFDEPFGALDPITRHEIQHQFRSLKPLLQKTTVIVTHDIIEAAELADRIVVMDGGEIQQIGSAKDLLANPQNSFVQDLLSPFHLQVRLVSISLNECIPFLERISPSGDEPTFQGGDSLYQAINQLTSEPEDSRLTIRSSDSEVTTSVRSLRSLVFSSPLQPGEDAP